jgi:hypothetical protein
MLHPEKYFSLKIGQGFLSPHQMIQHAISIMMIKNTNHKVVYFPYHTFHTNYAYFPL